MDVRFINPFIQATNKVFGVMVNAPVAVVRTMAARTLPQDPDSVNAVVELHGDVEGLVVLRFPSKIVYGVAQAFAGSSVDEVYAHDAIGELANMVAGNAKQDLYGRSASLSIPRVVVGDLTDLERTGDAPWLVISLSSRVGNFQLLVNLVMSCAIGSP